MTERESLFSLRSFRINRGNTIYGSWAFIGPAYIRWLDYDHEDGCLWSIQVGALEVSWRLPRWRYDAWRPLRDEADDLLHAWFEATGDLRFFTLAEARASLREKAAANG